MTGARIVSWSLVALLGLPALARAQTPVEITPFGGYRFGGGFFELITGEPVDLDGAPAFGIAVDVPIRDPHGYQIEGLFSHEEANLTVRHQPFGPATIARVTVDHWMGGGLQEFDVLLVAPGAVGSFSFIGDDWAVLSVHSLCACIRACCCFCWSLSLCVCVCVFMLPSA